MLEYDPGSLLQDPPPEVQTFYPPPPPPPQPPFPPYPYDPQYAPIPKYTGLQFPPPYQLNDNYYQSTVQAEHPKSWSIAEVYDENDKQELKNLAKEKEPNTTPMPNLKENTSQKPEQHTTQKIEQQTTQKAEQQTTQKIEQHTTKKAEQHKTQNAEHKTEKAEQITTEAAHDKSAIEQKQNYKQTSSNVSFNNTANSSTSSEQILIKMIKTILNMFLVKNKDKVKKENISRDKTDKLPKSSDGKTTKTRIEIKLENKPTSGIIKGNGNTHKNADVSKHNKTKQNMPDKGRVKQKKQKSNKVPRTKTAQALFHFPATTFRGILLRKN